jgi:hypothetical protein
MVSRKPSVSLPQSFFKHGHKPQSAGNVKKTAMWLRMCTDLETELGGAPMCDAHLFARCINHAKRWKEDLYDPGHWIKKLMEDEQFFMINLGPDATPRQVSANYRTLLCAILTCQTAFSLVCKRYVWPDCQINRQGVKVSGEPRECTASL